MTKRRAPLQPNIEGLEARTVLSGATLPQQDAVEVALAYQTFAVDYAKDVTTILLATKTSSSTSTTPSANRASFDAAVATSLATLDSSINTTIANLPTAATLGTSIKAEILGTSSTSLQGALTAVATPASTSPTAEIPFIKGSVTAILGSLGTVTKQVASAPSPTQTITVAMLQQDLTAIAAADRAFDLSYAQAINADLNNAQPSRATFDAAVATDLTTYETSVDAALANLPTSLASSLATTYASNLLAGTTTTGTSTTGTSLQSLLAALPTPTSSNPFSGLVFRFSSGLEILDVQGKVASELLVAANQYNASHPNS